MSSIRFAFWLWSGNKTPSVVLWKSSVARISFQLVSVYYGNFLRLFSIFWKCLVIFLWPRQGTRLPIENRPIIVLSSFFSSSIKFRYSIGSCLIFHSFTVINFLVNSVVPLPFLFILYFPYISYFLNPNCLNPIAVSSSNNFEAKPLAFV